MKRQYVCLVKGLVTTGGTITTQMGRHPTKRTHQTVLELGGRLAVTHYKIRQRFTDFTLLNVTLETGRTHQIRVHMAHIRYPIVGDQTYGQRPKFPKGASEELLHCLQHFKRQALHAHTLTLTHPITGEPCTWEAPIANDIVELCDFLGKENKF